ncbi:P1 [Badnavirus ziziphi]|uniref:P1 n=1 Tax=Jujube associated badnavirus TaxID=2761560 RepID=A0A7G7XNM8_9VIRU|nr:P1 [Jujube associated badnavirus]UNA88847.1 P1 [Jujube associated badnavirus]BDT80127.1 P1 [Jujube associated badnavirus]BDT80131.1 P1 [Jujube associated badnavirus]BDT80138.1 P1 [Jujube associated badnavirus]
MSERFESAIKKWYEESATANLEYLDLAENQKPSLSHINHNISVIYDRVSLFAKVSLKQFKQILEENHSFKFEIINLRKHISVLEKEIHSSKPLSKAEIRELVVEISKQPKLVEEQALKLTEALNKQVKKVESLLHEVKTLIGG